MSDEPQIGLASQQGGAIQGPRQVFRNSRPCQPSWKPECSRSEKAPLSHAAGRRRFVRQGPTLARNSASVWPILS